ncbi:Hexapeptide repeat of succinyl-transferase [Austwickia chelonae]|uniref:Acetyltransferase n=1 Tax=Austwickia chelonae NBRC 105200 TaxID=1184607 RepID=K6UMJ3_9MICO|nr:acyltransferase [Austwickia chelonae]GAB78166.1 hypothetical protein AUCHE_08_04110 [Austwickia chelonae NBRC 105200]SEV98046.1 Hexapeptide repeat of succinyl-transferase [Austwickia chelonae]
MRRHPGCFAGPPLIRGDVRITLTAHSRIGAELNADGRLETVLISARQGGRLILGERVYLNRGSSVEALHEVRIGDDVLFGPNATVLDDDFHPLEPARPTHRGPTVLEDNIWLGRNVLVTPGVRIGRGTAVGANSVVTRDLPPGVFAAGSPARPLRELNIPAHGWDRHWRAPTTPSRNTREAQTSQAPPPT